MIPKDKNLYTYSKIVDDNFNVIFEITSNRSIYNIMYSVISNEFSKYINE